MTINPAQKAQINLLLVEKVTILAKYVDFANIFSKIISKYVFKIN